MKYLKLSPGDTSAFIRDARKAKEVPDLKAVLEKQEISVSKARKITAVLTKDNSDHWLELAKTLPRAQLEKEVARVAPQMATPERAKYVTEDRIQINVGVSEKTMRKLRRIQDLVSQKSRKSASMEDALDELLEIYLQRHDHVEKAKRLARPEEESKLQQGPGPVGEKRTRNTPARTKHQINLRDQGQCTHVSEGKRCESKRWLETHHQIPFSLGGSNELNNLTTLCWLHHRMHHH